MRIMSTTALVMAMLATQVNVGGQFAALPEGQMTSVEQQLQLEKRLQENPYCGETCKLWLKWPSTSNQQEKEQKFAPSSVW